MVKVFLVLFSPVDSYLFHFCQYHQNVGIHPFGQQFGRMVLINDSRHPLQCPIHILNHRNPSPAA